MNNVNNGNGQVTTMSKLDIFKSKMNSDSVTAQFKNALGDNYGSFAASLIDLFTSDSYLQECDTNAVIMQALKAALLKLPINKSLGFAYIIAYKGKPEFQMGYKGYIQLAMRSGQYKTINNDVVYEGEYRTRNKLTGEFDLNGMATSANEVGYFAYFELINGFSKTFYMTKEQVIAHAKRYSPSFALKNGPWTVNFPEMAKKTVLKYLLSHYGLLSPEMVNAFDSDDVADRVDDEIKDNANIKPFDLSQDNNGIYTTEDPANRNNPAAQNFDFQNTSNSRAGF